MQYRLRTLMILLGVMPPILAAAWLNREWVLPASLLLAVFTFNLFVYVVLVSNPALVSQNNTNDATQSSESASG